MIKKMYLNLVKNFSGLSSLLFRLINKIANIDISPWLILYVVVTAIIGFCVTFSIESKVYFLEHTENLDIFYKILDPLLIFLITALCSFFLLSYLFYSKGKGLKRFMIRLIVSFILGISVFILFGVEKYMLKPAFSYDRPHTQFEKQLIYSLFFRDVELNEQNIKLDVDKECFNDSLTMLALEFYNLKSHGFIKINPYNFISDYERISLKQKKNLIDKLKQISNHNGMYNLSISIGEQIRINESIHNWKCKEIKTLLSDRISFVSADEIGDSCPSGFVMRQVLILLISLLLIRKGNREVIPFINKIFFRSIFIVINLGAFFVIIFSRWYGYQHTIFDMSVSLNSVVFFFLILILIIEAASRKLNTNRIIQLKSINRYINVFESFSTKNFSSNKNEVLISDVLAFILSRGILENNVDRVRVYIYREIPNYKNGKLVVYKYLIAKNSSGYKEGFNLKFLDYNIELEPNPSEFEKNILIGISQKKPKQYVLKKEHFKKVDKDLLGFRTNLKIYHFPLVTDDEKVFGLVSCDNISTQRDLSNDAIDSIETLCRHAVNHFSIQRQIDVLKSLGDIFKKIIIGIDMDVIINRVAQELCHSIDAECVSILIVNNKNGHLELKKEWTYCLSQENTPPEEDLFEDKTTIWYYENNRKKKVVLDNESLTYKTLKKGKSLISNNLYIEYSNLFCEEIVNHWNSYLPSCNNLDKKIKQVMFIPLLTDATNDVRGIIRVYNKTDRKYNNGNYQLSELGFSTNDLKLINELTPPLLLAIEMIQKNEEKITFSHRITHNIHEPLSGVVSYLSRLTDLKNSNQPYNIEEDFELIKIHIDYLILMVEMSKIFITGIDTDDDNKVSTSVLINEIKNIIDIYKKYYEIVESDILNILEDYENINGYVLGNIECVKELAFILIDNAVKYSIEGKRKIKINIIVIDNELRFTVQDFGIGMLKKDIKKVMNPLYRTELSKEKNIRGMGVGLTVVKMIFDKFNYKYKIISKKGIGTTFTVYMKLI